MEPAPVEYLVRTSWLVNFGWVRYNHAPDNRLQESKSYAALVFSETVLLGGMGYILFKKIRS